MRVLYDNNTLITLARAVARVAAGWRGGCPPPRSRREKRSRGVNEHTASDTHTLVSYIIIHSYIIIRACVCVCSKSRLFTLVFYIIYVYTCIMGGEMLSYKSRNLVVNLWKLVFRQRDREKEREERKTLRLHSHALSPGPAPPRALCV